MNDTTKFGPWIRRFLLEHLVSERNLARNTQRSYRDTIALLVPFIAGKVHKHVDELDINHVSAENVQKFLQDLEETRGCSVTTRNQRLAVIHALAHFIRQRCPEHIEWCGRLRAIPFKRTAKVSITYLEKSEMDALLAAPDRNTAQGRRDYGLLLFLYNTGARADEAAQLKIRDLSLTHSPRKDHSSVTIHGKGKITSPIADIVSGGSDYGTKNEPAHVRSEILRRDHPHKGSIGGTLLRGASDFPYTMRDLSVAGGLSTLGGSVQTDVDHSIGLPLQNFSALGKGGITIIEGMKSNLQFARWATNFAPSGATENAIVNNAVSANLTIMILGNPSRSSVTVYDSKQLDTQSAITPSIQANIEKTGLAAIGAAIDQAGINALLAL